MESGRCYSLDIGEDYTVKGLLFNKDSNTKVYIDGTSKEYDEDADGIVEVFDPFATVAISEYAWNRLGGLSYSAASLEMPAENILEPGDVFTVLDTDGSEKTAIVMEQQLTVSCTGGFVEKISCEAESKKQTRNSENRAESTENQASKSTIEKLQTTGSDYWAVTDSNGLCVGKGDTRIAYITQSDSGFLVNAYGPHMIGVSGGKVSAYTRGDITTASISVGGTDGEAMRILSQGDLGNTRFDVAHGSTIELSGALTLSSAGLFVNGKKVVTED